MSINYESLNYTDTLNSLLQKRIKLTINGKIVRQGHLVLYKFKNFCIELQFKNTKEGKTRKTEIPIPFCVTSDINGIEFDYRLDTLCGDTNTTDIFRSSIRPTDSKFYNKRLNIEIL